MLKLFSMEFKTLALFAQVPLKALMTAPCPWKQTAVPNFCLILSNTPLTVQFWYTVCIRNCSCILPEQCECAQD